MEKENPKKETFVSQQAWKQSLPSLLEECVRRWSLTLLPAFNQSVNYVTPVLRADGTPAILKLCVPGIQMVTEIETLRLYGGKGMVRALEVDAERGILLLEQVQPGTPLTTLANEAQDAEATRVLAEVMRGMRCPAPADHPFPTIEDWGKGFQKLRHRFEGGTGPLSAPFVAQAEALFQDLLVSASEPVLLHGDLHHDNILYSETQGWIAIDPQGVVGEPAYEVGAMLRNLWEDRHLITDPKRLLERRIAQLSEELAIERERVWGWGVAQAVLSAWWCIEDEWDCWEGAMALAELLASIPA